MLNVVASGSEVKTAVPPAQSAPASELVASEVVIDQITLPATKASEFADTLFASGAYDNYDDERASEIGKDLVAKSKINNQIGVGILDEYFQSNDLLLNHISSIPFGYTQITDEMTSSVRNVPVLESEAAIITRDRMSVAGIAPLFITDAVAFALRVDEHTKEHLDGSIVEDVMKVMQELSTLNPELSLEGKPIAFIPVSTKTYDMISSALVNPSYRAEKSVESCDQHFALEALNVDTYESQPSFLALRDAYPTNPIMSIIQSMHFDPFIEAQSVNTPKVDGQKNEAYGVSNKDVLSIFDPPSDMGFLLDRSNTQGFIPLRIDRNEANRPVVVVGFRAYETNRNRVITAADGGYQKRDYRSVCEDLDLYRQSILSILKDHFPKDLSIKEFKLVPIPNNHFDDLLAHLVDPVARKNTLQIIDRPVGTLNHQQLIKYAVEKGAQEIYMHLDDSGPSVRLGIGASVVKAPFRYSREAFIATIQSLTAVMTNKVANTNVPFEGQIRFAGASHSDFEKWESCFKKGEAPPKIPNAEGNLSIYPRSLHGISLRLQFTPLISGPQIVIRIHRMQKNPPRVSELGLRPEAAEGIQKVMGINSGMVLFVAPTGSGKSTLMAAILREKNDPSRVIMTMEKPVEFRIPGISQVDINETAGRTQPEVLKSFLRSAPGIIMLGEIRDREEANIALEAGLTGHLIMSTLHTNDAPEAMVRLLNMKVDPFFLSSAVNAIVSQRLIKQFKPLAHSLKYQADLNVVERYDCRNELEALIARKGVFDQPIWAYRPKSAKNATGECYQGRVPVNEIIMKTPELSALFTRKVEGEGAGWNMGDLIQVLRTQNNPEVKFEPMVVGGLRWVLEGRTSLKALYEGEKVIPVSQFATYADEIIALIKERQGNSNTIH